MRDLNDLKLNEMKIFTDLSVNPYLNINIAFASSLIDNI